MRHVGVKLAAFTSVDYIFRHFICSRPIEPGSVCFSRDGPRGRMVATGPRVDVVEDHSTFFWCYAFLANPSCTFSEQLSSYYSKGLGSMDDLSSLFFVFWEFFSEDVRNVQHCPVGSDDQNFHDQVDHSWDLNFSRICGTFWLRGFFDERILLNSRCVDVFQKHINGNGFSLGTYFAKSSAA